MQQSPFGSFTTLITVSYSSLPLVSRLQLNSKYFAHTIKLSLQVHIHNILTAVFLLLLSLVASPVMPFSKSFLRVKDCAGTQHRLLGITTDNLSHDIWVFFVGLSPVRVLSWALYSKLLFLRNRPTINLQDPVCLLYNKNWKN